MEPSNEFKFNLARTGLVHLSHSFTEVYQVSKVIAILFQNDQGTVIFITYCVKLFNQYILFFKKKKTTQQHLLHSLQQIRTID